MKNIFVIIFIFLGFGSVEAQGLISSNSRANTGGDHVRRSIDTGLFNFDRSIEGTPFLFDKMYPGRVYYTSGEANDFTEMGINIADNEVFVMLNGMVTVLDNEKVQTLEIYIDDDQALVYYPFTHLNKIRYFELLYNLEEEGAIMIYHEKYFTSTDNRTELISVTNDGDAFKYRNDLFWYLDGEVSKIKSGNSGLKLVFGEDWKKAKSIANKNELTFKEHQDWIRILDLMKN